MLNWHHSEDRAWPIPSFGGLIWAYEAQRRDGVWRTCAAPKPPTHAIGKNYIPFGPAYETATDACRVIEVLLNLEGVET